MAGALPEGWAEFREEGGQTYYHHAGLGLTQWERPEAPPGGPRVRPSPSSRLPSFLLHPPPPLSPGAAGAEGG